MFVRCKIDVKKTFHVSPSGTRQLHEDTSSNGMTVKTWSPVDTGDLKKASASSRGGGNRQEEWAGEPGGCHKGLWRRFLPKVSEPSSCGSENKPSPAQEMSQTAL